MYAVLFDIDGTLIQTGGAGQLAFAEAFRAEFGVPVLSGAVPFAGRSDRAIALDLMRVHGVEPSEANWRRFVAAYLERLPAALEHREGRVLPGVGLLLDHIEALGDPLIGILTGNVRDGASHKLAYYGLNDRFAFGGYGDEATERSDIAAQALAAAEQFAHEQRRGANGSRPRAMVIGDTVHDIRCARAIGAVAVAVATGGSNREELAGESPDLLLDDLTDAASVLRLIREAS
jgi:phosphoglycolate phosphatase-like HAD superfamily hydrolase